MNTTTKSATPANDTPNARTAEEAPGRLAGASLMKIKTRIKAGFAIQIGGAFAG